MLVLATAAAARGAEANLLRNPGFEDVGPNGVPTSWTREYNEKLSGPFALAADAHAGKRAACLITGEWGFLRPQFLTQDVPLPAGAAVCRLSALCKGQGLVNLVLQFRKDGQPLATETVDMGFGPTQAPKESLNAFGLEQDYQPYAVAVDVPANATAVRVKVGNSVGMFDRLNVWGKVWIDDVSLTVDMQGKAAPSVPSLEVKPAPDALPGLVDIAPYARITTEPAAFNTGALADGDVQTRCAFAAGLERAANLSFIFPKALPIRAVQLYLVGWVNASEFTIRGDLDGAGHYKTLLARASGLTTNGWVTVMSAEKKPLRAIRIQAIDGKNLYGFRDTSCFASEVRVLAAKKDAAVAELEPQAVYRRAWPLAAGVPEAVLTPVEFKPPMPAKCKFRKMVCADLWMWGINATADGKAPDLARNPGFTDTVQKVKAAGCNAVMVDLTVSSCQDLMPWPSKVCKCTKENYLKALVDALHAQGLEVMVELIHNITPFETIKWHYPQEETSRYPGMKQYPSVANGTYFRDNWLTILDEVMACGVDGVGLSSDESYYRPAFLATLPADDPGRGVYRKRFGHDVPGREEDTLAFRQWVQLRHESISDVYGYIAGSLRKKYPAIYLNTMWMVPTTGGSWVTELCIPWDAVAARADITELGSDYMGPYGIRMGSAANGWRKGTMLHSGNLGSKEPDIHYYGTTLWSLMYGAGSSDYWRWNWIEDNGSIPALTRVYTMVRELESLGVWDARPPATIALLTSRCSLDWWQVKSWWGKPFDKAQGKHDDPAWDRGLEGQRGWFAEETVFNILQKNGYAFNWFYLDRPDQTKQIAGHRILIASFAYSVSQDAADKVKAAVAAGATLVLIDGRQGETDEWGEPRPAPAFKELVDSGKAIVLPEDILAWGSTDAFAEKVMAAIDNTLGRDNPLKMARYNHNVDATLIEKGPKEKFVFAINWEKSPAVVDLGLSLPEGSYEVRARDENQWRQVSIGGRTALSRTDLASFRLNLGPEKPYVLYVSEKK